MIMACPVHSATEDTMHTLLHAIRDACCEPLALGLRAMHFMHEGKSWVTLQEQ